MTVSQEIINSLQILGLDPKEIEAYLALSRSPGLTILELSKHTGIPRTSMYRISQSLVSKGFVIIHKIEDIEIYVAKRADELGHLSREIEQKLLTTETVLSELPKLLIAPTTEPPIFLYIRALDEFRKLLNQQLKTGFPFSLIISHEYSLSNLFTAKFLRNVTKASSIRALYSGTEDFSNAGITIRNGQQKVEGILFISESITGFFEGELEMLSGAYIESNSLAHIQLKMFEQLWESVS